MDQEYKKIAIVGAGYVGLTLAIHMANCGLSILCIDIDEKKIEALRKGKIPIFETGIETALQQAIKSRNLNFAVKALPEQKIEAWIVATPYIPGQPDQYLKTFDDILPGPDGVLPLISVRTTIPVGMVRRRIIPYLTQKFGKGPDQGFFLSVTPERTLSGATVEELASLPQLIGGTPAAMNRTATLFARCGIRSIPLESYEAAELAKTFTNFYRFAQFNLANFFGVCCQQFNINENIFSKTLSDKYERFQLKAPGPGAGGFCLPKDALLLFEGLKAVDDPSDGAIDYADLFEYPQNQYKLNEGIISFHQRLVLNAVKTANRILALGIAFKGIPETDDVRGSTGVKIIKEIMRAGKNVEVFDCNVSVEKIRQLGLRPISSIADLSIYDALLILNNNPRYREILQKSNKSKIRSYILYDPWRILARPEDRFLQDKYILL